MANATFTVHTKPKKGLAVIRPPSDKATKGNGRLEVTNKTQSDIFVQLPGGIFEDGTGQLNPNPEIVPVQPGNPNRLVRNVHATATAGAFDFQVFSLETFTFAQANSDPEFIIEA